ncbi:MAG: sugar phosphate isomerase/epimerase family protein [Opitutales bacterium]
MSQVSRASTRTGDFPIGFRRGWSDWQKDTAALIAYAVREGFGCIDWPGEAFDEAKQCMDAGLRVGSVDLPGDWAIYHSADAGKRAEALETLSAHVEKWAALGPMNHFAVMFPEDPAKPRSQNFEHMAAFWKEGAAVLEKHKAKLVIEGWPGKQSLCCTPESLQAFFDAVPSPALGVNYDPSHLIRMGIDPMRFLEQFRDRVYHAHGKDARVYPERLYQAGWETEADHTEGFGFGGVAWRYTIPGHGTTDWVGAFETLKANGYEGCVSIELEDQNFNGSEQGEKDGLCFSRDYLRSC